MKTCLMSIAGKLVLFISVALAALVPSPPEVFAKNSAANATLVPYKGTIEHVFFHPLIVRPTSAFFTGKKGTYMCDWFVTASEFHEFLNEIYQRGYVLVSLSNLIEEHDGKFTQKTIYLPAGKKPLILSVDDLNYYRTMQTHGVAKRLALRDGKLYTVIDSPDGEQFLSDHEVITIVDNFIDEHPDFSWKGAKGIIALTGFKGVFGYNTVPAKNPMYESERVKAFLVAQYLKLDGWEFASHGYRHLAENKTTIEKLEIDAKRWKDEVEPIIGSTQIHIYPFGDIIHEGDPKLDLMKKFGFRYFFGVTFISTLKIQGDSVYGDRIPIDGKYVMGRVSGSRSSPFCNIKSVIDPARIAVFGKKTEPLIQSTKILTDGKSLSQ